CRAQVMNRGGSAVRVRQIVLFDVAHDLPDATPIYGEGFQMLSQTGGALGRPVDLGNYTDAKHYRLPEPDGATVVYSVLAIGAQSIIAFTSCHRFVGRFELRPRSLRVIVDAEGLTLAPGERWDLETLVLESSGTRDAMLADGGRRGK